MDSTTSQDNSQEPYPNAGRASGYTDEQGHAIGENIINRVTELIAAPQTKLIQLAAQFDALVKAQNASVKVQDQRFQYLLGQLDAHLEKEDTRHGVYDKNDANTLAALTSVAHRLDEITSYVQQSVTIAREALDVAKAGAMRLGKLEKRVMRIDARDARQYKHTKQLFRESQDDRQTLHETDATILKEVAGVKAEVEDLKKQITLYVAGSKRAEVEDLRREIDLLKQVRDESDG